VVQAGDDPSTQASLRSSMDLGRSMTFDATLAHVAGQPSPLAPGSPGAPGYYDLTARFAWQVSRAVNLSLSGFNLTQAHHIEFALPYGEEISRSFIAEARVYLW
jgi:iron complex outermembrane receptor protein